MLSPLPLNPPKVGDLLDDSSSDGACESFRERNGSYSLSLVLCVDVDDEGDDVVGDWFRLRLAILEEGGTGSIGIERPFLVENAGG